MENKSNYDYLDCTSEQIKEQFEYQFGQTMESFYGVSLFSDEQIKAIKCILSLNDYYVPNAYESLFKLIFLKKQSSQMLKPQGKYSVTIIDTHFKLSGENG